MYIKGLNKPISKANYKKQSMGTINPQYCSSSNQASMDGTDDGREEEAEMSNPHTCSSSNRANISLAAIEQVWMVLAMRNPDSYTCDTLCWMKSKFFRIKNLMRPTLASYFG